MKPRRQWSGRVWRLIGFTAFAVLLIGGGLLTWATVRYSRAVQKLTRGVGDTTFVAADGSDWFRLDEEHHDVPLARISSNLQRAVLAVEDRRFFYHPGIDPIGVLRAVARDLRGGREGASTLTQQLARTVFLSNSRTVGRKAREAAIALVMEVQLTKPQILELYLNRIYLSAGVYGVETMSEHLFRKSANDVSLAEAAMIAGLIRAPSTLSPWSNYEGALTRSHVVLALMREQGLITAEQEQGARRDRPKIQPYRQAREGATGWAKEYLRQQFRDVFGGDHPPDWHVQTTFDRNVQAAAEQAIAAGMKRLNKPGLEAALVAIDPATGDVLAMVGGSDYMRSTFNRAVRSRRQPGSAFKPFVYASALAKGQSPVSLLSGLSSVTAPEDPEWAPTSEQGLDALTLRDALAASNNAAAATLQQQVGSQAVLRLASDAGLQHLPDVPSLALGAGEVTPLDLTVAYSMFASGGNVPAARAIRSVTDADGSEVYAQPVAVKRVISEPVAFQMTTMLRDVVEHGTGSGVRAAGVRGAVAGKTGTTDDYHDAWFVGFSSSVVAGVWVGFDQPAPIGRDAYAARVAVPIWADFMKRIAKARPAAEFVKPSDIEEVTLCSVSHLRPVQGCPTYTEYFKDGDAVPSQRCDIHQGSFEDRTARAVDGFFRGLGSKIAGIFKRKK